jgi:all-trans-retinol 13,14-reductase
VHDVVIIGSGLGGLACGNILSREGMRVAVLEKGPKPGGALQSFERNGVPFDTGVHYIGRMAEGETLNRYFTFLGLTGKLKLKRLNTDCFDRIAFDDGEFPLAQGFENFTEQLLPYFPGSRDTLESYIRTIREIAGSFPLYNLRLPGDTDHELPYRSRSAFDFYHQFSTIHHCHCERSEAISPVTLSSVLSGNNFLYAARREFTPLHIPALINHSFISSAWVPVGGSGQIADLLCDTIRENGGEILTGKEVVSIGKTAEGFSVVTKDGETILAKKVISAIHPVNTLRMLAPEMVRNAFAIRLNRLKNTLSSFALYIVLKNDTFPQLDHNYYYQSTADTWDTPSGDGWPGSWLFHTPIVSEEDRFARGVSVVSPMHFDEVRRWAEMPGGTRESSYREFREERAERLIRQVESRFPGFRSKIVSMEISTPLTWVSYTGTAEGSMYGIQKDHHDPLGTMIFPNTKIPGFYFTGQSVNLHGVLGTTVGAMMTCGSILGLEYLLEKVQHG